MKYYPTRDANDRFVNTCAWTPSQRKCGKAKKIKRAKTSLEKGTIATYVKVILKSRVRASCRARLLRRCLTKTSFQLTIAAAIVAFGATVDNRDEELEAWLSTQLAVYIKKVRAKLTKQYSDITMIAVMLNLLSEGLDVRKVNIFPMILYLKQRVPSPVGYSLVPGLQCRAMSNATRGIRALFISKVAIPMDLVFPKPPLKV